MTVAVVPPHWDLQETTRIAAELLAAADDPSDVKIDTSGSLVFVVPEGVAKKAKIQINDEPERKRPGRSRKATQ